MSEELYKFQATLVLLTESMVLMANVITEATWCCICTVSWGTSLQVASPLKNMNKNKTNNKHLYKFNTFYKNVLSYSKA